MNFRTGLADVRGLGSARSGTGHFWTQRMTAVSNLPLVSFLVWFIAAHIDATRAEIGLSVQSPWIALPLALAFVSITLHMRLGAQIVIEDYVHQPVAKYACLLANTFYVIALLAAALFAILKMNFG